MRKFFVIWLTAVVPATMLFSQSIAKSDCSTKKMKTPREEAPCCKPQERECCPPKEKEKPPCCDEKKNPCCNVGPGAALPTDKKCFPPAYNAPAGIDVKGCDIDVFGSFLYWHVSQDDMDLAHVAPSFTGTGFPGAVAFQDFKYKPGFKAGIGFNTDYDGWVGWVEYTWLHQTTMTTQVAPLTSTGAAGIWTAQDWFITTPALTGPSVSSKWKLKLDYLDVIFSRPFYQGTKITIDPFAGLRGLRLNQDLRISLGVPMVSLKSKAWAVGPEAGVAGHWMLGTSGFRFEGRTAGSLLYMRYHKISQKEQDTSTGPAVTTSFHNMGTVRPIAELGVGIGWGSYLACNNYYIDFSARYDFMLMWDQNVMREFNSYLSGFVDAPGDLQMHGLTASMRFDF